MTVLDQSPIDAGVLHLVVSLRRSGNCYPEEKIL